MRRACALGLVLILVTACGNDDSTTQAVAGPSTHVIPDDDTSASETSDDWCDTFRDLTTHPESATVDVRSAADSAPEAVRDAMRTVASNDPSISAAQFIDATAEVEAWAHEHCGTDHPFCGAWIQYKGLVAGIALSGAAEDEQMRAYEEAEELFEVAGRYAPPVLAQHLDTISSTSVLSDDQEREVESAFNEVDAWVDGNC